MTASSTSSSSSSPLDPNLESGVAAVVTAIGLYALLQLEKEQHALALAIRQSLSINEPLPRYGVYAAAACLTVAGLVAVVSLWRAYKRRPVLAGMQLLLGLTFAVAVVNSTVGFRYHALARMEASRQEEIANLERLAMPEALMAELTSKLTTVRALRDCDAVFPVVARLILDFPDDADLNTARRLGVQRLCKVTAQMRSAL